MSFKELWIESNPKSVDPGPLLLMFFLEIKPIKIKYKLICLLLLLAYRTIYWIVSRNFLEILLQGISYLLAFGWLLAEWKGAKQ